MTYYNGNPYAGPTESAPLDKWAHDGCLPDAFFESHRWRDGDVTRHQVWPWHWSPVWGDAMPCAWCGQPVEELTGRGTWRPLAPATCGTHGRGQVCHGQWDTCTAPAVRGVAA